MNESEVSQQLRERIDEFIAERLRLKLDKLKDTEDDQVKRQQLLDAHQRENWLADAARRAGQLQLVTHTVKPIHQYAKGVEIYHQEQFSPDAELVSTNCLASPQLDVVGNAAVLDVFKLLKLQVENENLISRLLRDDPVALEALADDPHSRRQLADGFLRLAESSRTPASHTLAKQVYFPIGDDQYHLLAPLFSSSLVHEWFLRLQSERFSDEVKASREARRKGLASEKGYRDFRNLAVLSFGGSKPQNVSQLNSERGGKAYLLPCLPPVWSSLDTRAPTGARSIFDGPFSRRKEVRLLTQALRAHLKRHAKREENTQEIRHQRAGLVAQIVDELVQYTARIQKLVPGWSLAVGCRLSTIEAAWLDPYAWGDSEDEQARDAVPNWPELVAERFAVWLNRIVESPDQAMGSVEARQWKHELLPFLAEQQQHHAEERSLQEVQHVR